MDMEVPKRANPACDCGNESDPSLQQTGFPICKGCWGETLSFMQNAKKNKFTVSCNKILDNLYLGNEEASMDLSGLRENGVTHILVCGNYLQECFPESFEYLKLPIDDAVSQDLFAYFKDAINFIKNAKVVLVHCAAGMSRSPSMVIAYLMAVKGMQYKEAFDFAKERRRIVMPNPGFCSQLKKLGKMLESGEFKLE